MAQSTNDDWARFVREYGPRIHAYATKRFGLRQADAEDVTQDVLIRLIQKCKCFESREGTSFDAWVFTVAQRVIVDSLRRTGRQRFETGGSSHQEQMNSLPDNTERRLDDDSREFWLATAIESPNLLSWEPGTTNGFTEQLLAFLGPIAPNTPPLLARLLARLDRDATKEFGLERVTNLKKRRGQPTWNAFLLLKVMRTKGRHAATILNQSIDAVHKNAKRIERDLRGGYACLSDNDSTTN